MTFYDQNMTFYDQNMTFYDQNMTKIWLFTTFSLPTFWKKCQKLDFLPAGGWGINTCGYIACKKIYLYINFNYIFNINPHSYPR